MASLFFFSAFVYFVVTLLIFLVFVFFPRSGGKSGNKKADGVKVIIFYFDQENV